MGEMYKNFRVFKLQIKWLIFPSCTAGPLIKGILNWGKRASENGPLFGLKGRSVRNISKF